MENKCILGCNTSHCLLWQKQPHTDISLVSDMTNFFPRSSIQDFFQLSNIVGFLACRVSFKSFQINPSQWDLNLDSVHYRNLQILAFIFSYSLVDLLECWGSLSCCKVPFQLSISLLRDSFTLSSSTSWSNEERIHSGFYNDELPKPWFSKVAPSSNISTTCFVDGNKLESESE